MKITVTKLTDYDLMNAACAATTGGSIPNIDPYRLYKSEHSPIRTQMFWIVMENIPTFVSVHMVRHKFGVEHFVRSNRPDRGGYAEANRNTPVTHAMLINAQALINMARKRLCNKASKETQMVMSILRDSVGFHDAALAKAMVKDCIYRGGCYELKPCRQHVEKMAKEGGVA